MEFIDFNSAINSDLPIAADFSNPSNSVLIAFGGILGAMGIPPFEFFSLTREMQVNKIYLRDLKQAWYHHGLPGVADNINDLVLFLDNILDKNGVEKTVLVGNSMGGFAAILFGVLLSRKVLVHAFSPQTFIDRLNRYIHKDDRWSDQIQKQSAYRSAAFRNQS